jgi:hypothetical protein
LPQIFNTAREEDSRLSDYLRPQNDRRRTSFGGELAASFEMPEVTRKGASHMLFVRQPFLHESSASWLRLAKDQAAWRMTLIDAFTRPARPPRSTMTFQQPAGGLMMAGDRSK